MLDIPVEKATPTFTFSNAPVMLFDGTVMHARLKPPAHRFTYSVFNVLMDLDELETADKISPLFGVNRFAFVSFHEKDHGPGSDTGLADYARHLLRSHGVGDTIKRIHLLCYPRIFGYVFNPISVYFCEGDHGLAAIIYEVRNTFGGIHTYVESVLAGQIRKSGLRQHCDKRLHVSPFLGMSMRYFFRIQKKGDTLSIRILEEDATGPILSATLSAKEVSFTSRAVASRLLKRPFLTLKVMIAIHFEAARLWIKGAKFHPNPHKSKRAENLPDAPHKTDHVQNHINDT